MRDVVMPHAALRASGIRFLGTAMLLTAMAAGMGWGIRGQYGHESGAMIAGALTSLTLVMLFVPNVTSLSAARAAAMTTVAIGIGGTMTYGQTVGLTHNKEMVGNWTALGWGMLGLAIKGGIWISFAGAFLGMGLGGKRYRPLEMTLLFVGLFGLLYLGLWLLNSPYDPTTKTLPRIYFSASWDFEPENVNLKPRREVWGGLLLALIGMVLYCGAIRRDGLAVKMAMFGGLGGALGFPGGQSLQAFHSWNADLFNSGALSSMTIFRYFNWWNMMETTFGLIFGAVLALGLWLNRRSIAIETVEQDVPLQPTTEVALVCLHLSLLLSSEFLRLPGAGSIVSSYTDMGITMCVLPMIGIAGGRFWPYLLLLPVVAAPICGKQIRNLVYADEPQFSIAVGWVLFALIPMALTVTMATHLISGSYRKNSAGRFAAVALLLVVWLYFGLNTTFFQFAWPWLTWTTRTPNQLIFSLCAACLTTAALVSMNKIRSVA